VRGAVAGYIQKESHATAWPIVRTKNLPRAQCRKLFDVVMLGMDHHAKNLKVTLACLSVPCKYLRGPLRSLNEQCGDAAPGLTGQKILLRWAIRNHQARVGTTRVNIPQVRVLVEAAPGNDLVDSLLKYAYTYKRNEKVFHSRGCSIGRRRQEHPVAMAVRRQSPGANTHNLCWTECPHLGQARFAASG
jgi:hypothetical protein